MEESATHIRVHLPALFYDDLRARGQSFGTVLRRTQRYVLVDLDDWACDEMIAFARLYCSGDMARVLRRQYRRGLVSSAAATLRRLQDLDREKHRVPADAVTVDLPARVWGHARHFVRCHPLLTEVREVGDRTAYRLTFRRDDAQMLMRHFMLGFAPTWKAAKGLRYGYRECTGRVLEALGIDTPAHVYAGVRLQDPPRRHASASLESH